MCSNGNTREVNRSGNCKCFGHNSEPCGNFGTISRHKLPIIHPELPIPTRDLNSSIQPKFLNPAFFYTKPTKLREYQRPSAHLFVCTVEQIHLNLLIHGVIDAVTVLSYKYILFYCNNYKFILIPVISY